MVVHSGEVLYVPLQPTSEVETNNGEENPTGGALVRVRSKRDTIPVMRTTRQPFKFDRVLGWNFHLEGKVETEFMVRNRATKYAEWQEQ